MTSSQLSSRLAAGLLAVFAFVSNHLIFILVVPKKIIILNKMAGTFSYLTIGNLGALRHCRPNAFFAFSLA